MKNFLLIILCCTTLSFVRYPENTAGIYQASLKTLDGKEFNLGEISQRKAAVFIYLLPDCPACINYSRTLNRMSDQYLGKSVEFFGVFPSFVKKDEILGFKKDYKIKFRLLMDDRKQLQLALQANVSPEAFLIGPKEGILYRGRIDNWMYAVGKKRSVITSHELDDAIRSLIEGKKIEVPQTTAIGCFID